MKPNQRILQELAQNPNAKWVLFSIASYEVGRSTSGVVMNLPVLNNKEKLVLAATISKTLTA